MVLYEIYKEIDNQTCIKRSHFQTKKKWYFKTDDLLKEEQFIWNFI